MFRLGLGPKDASESFRQQAPVGLRKPLSRLLRVLAMGTGIVAGTPLIPRDDHFVPPQPPVANPG